MSRAPSPDRFETIAWVSSASDLALLLSLFEHADIPVQRHGYFHTSLQWELSTALGGIELRVHERDGDEARALLASLDYPPYRAPFFSGLWPLWLAFFAVTTFVFGVAPPPRQLPTYVLRESPRRDA